VKDRRRTKIFKNGNSKAVRIPTDFEVSEGDALVEKRGDRIIITPVQRTLGEVLRSIPSFSDDFMLDREQPQKDGIDEALFD
jgi:antitoxin VapB